MRFKVGDLIVKAKGGAVPKKSMGAYIHHSKMAKYHQMMAHNSPEEDAEIGHTHDHASDVNHRAAQAAKPKGAGDISHHLKARVPNDLLSHLTKQEKSKVDEQFIPHQPHHKFDTPKKLKMAKSVAAVTAALEARRK